MLCLIDSHNQLSHNHTIYKCHNTRTKLETRVGYEPGHQMRVNGTDISKN